MQTYKVLLAMPAMYIRRTGRILLTIAHGLPVTRGWKSWAIRNRNSYAEIL